MFAGLIRVRERSSEESKSASIKSVNASCPWIVETFNKALPTSKKGYWIQTGKSFMSQNAAMKSAKAPATKLNAEISF